MKKKFDIKSMLAGLIVGVGIFGCATAASTLVTGNVYFSPFPIVANGKSYASSSAILNYMGSTYVPLKELAELTGAKVTFNNNTIYVNNSTTTGNTTVNTTTFTEMELEKDAKDTVYVNLSKYNAQSATVSNSGSCVEVSQTYFSYNGTAAIEAVEEGKATITIRYNTGAIDYVYVTVTDDGEDELEIEEGDYEYIDIDLDDYDADKATLSITKGSSYISLGKTSVTKNTEVKVTGKKEGSATIKIKYDTGDTEYVYVEVVEECDDDDEDYREELEIEVDDYEYIDIDLDDYDADKATLSITKGSSYISLSKTKVTKNSEVRINADAEGEAKIKIKYDTGDVEYIFVEVVEPEQLYDYDEFDYEEELDIDVDDDETIYINLDKYDATQANISVISGKSYISLGKTSLTESEDIKIYGDEEGESIVKVVFNTGKTLYFWVEVSE